VTATFGAAGTVAGLVLRSSSATVGSSAAPTLIASQELLAAVAEADTAATAVHLSGTTGDEDRARRGLYLDALARAAGLVEEVAGLVGDDDQAHRELASIAIDLTSYSGRVEAARAANRAGSDGGDDEIEVALGLSHDTIAPSVATVTDLSRHRFETERDRGRFWQLAAMLLGVTAVVVLLWLQVGTYIRSNRILNPALVTATLAVAAAIAALALGVASRADALRRADSGGYDAITATASTQSAAFTLQTELSLRLLEVDGTGNDVQQLVGTIDQAVSRVTAGADSPRELAAADELAERWGRYRDTSQEILDLAEQGDLSEAIEAFQGKGSSTFNGMNTTVEGVLSDNRAQFHDGVAGAADAVGSLPLTVAGTSILAALATILGVQRRLDDYR
jgi:hypothetical protein